MGLINKCFVKVLGAGDIPRYGVAKGYGKWFEGHEAIPHPGDAVVFTWNGLGYFPGHDKYFSDHVGIVEYVEGNTVHTIEGNANGSNTSSTVCRKTYPHFIQEELTAITDPTGVLPIRLTMKPILVQ